MPLSLLCLLRGLGTALAQESSSGFWAETLDNGMRVSVLADPGDEVLVSTLTFSASVNPIRYVGAAPIFVDSERTSWNMDPALLAEALHAKAKAGKLPKAVIVVDLYG